MLPSRGVSSLHAATTLRPCTFASRQAVPSWRTTSRQFSQARLIQQSRQWSRNSSALRGHGSQTPRLLARAALGSPSVFSQGSGAARSLSLWPFGSKQPAKPADTLPAESVASSNPTASSPAAESTSAPPSAELTSNFAEHAPELSRGIPPANTDSIPSWDPNSSFGDFDTSSVLDIPEQIGYLKMLGLDFGWGPASTVQWVLEHIYIYTGMPWWVTIASMAALFRLALFYPAIRGSWHAAKFAELRQHPEFKAAQDEMWEANATRNMHQLSSARARMARLQNATGASTLKSFAPALVMVPFSFGAFRVLRAMAAMPVPSLETGGLLWFTDLSVCDPFYILPLVSSIISALSLKQSQRLQMGGNETTEKIGKFMMYGLTPFMFVVTMWMPAVLQWFFLCFGVGQFIQTTLTVTPAVRRWADLPALPDTPTLSPKKGVKIPGQEGPMYQAPTVKPGLKGKLESMVEGVDQEGIFDKFTGGAKSAERKKAVEYEKKRAQEEKEKKLQREDENRRRQMIKQQQAEQLREELMRQMQEKLKGQQKKK